MAKPKIPNTISDEKWRDLQDRARTANPRMTKFSDPEAVRRRKQAAEQFRKRQAS